MPAGFPKLMKQGSKQRFIYRARKFNDSVIFDPAVSVEADEEVKEEDKYPDNHAVSIQSSASMFIVILTVFFM